MRKGGNKREIGREGRLEEGRRDRGRKVERNVLKRRQKLVRGSERRDGRKKDR